MKLVSTGFRINEFAVELLLYLSYLLNPCFIVGIVNWIQVEFNKCDYVQFTLFSSSSCCGVYLALKGGHINSCIAMVQALRQSLLEVTTLNLKAMLMMTSSRSKSVEHVLRSTDDIVSKLWTSELTQSFESQMFPLEIGRVFISNNASI